MLETHSVDFAKIHQNSIVVNEQIANAFITKRARIRILGAFFNDNKIGNIGCLENVVFVACKVKRRYISIDFGNN
jgi:hypothetical protein